MANYMTEVAKMLGVELGEEFIVVFPNEPTYYTTAMLTNNGLNIVKSNVIDKQPWNVYCLLGLLNGTYIVKNKPWQPQAYETFYFVDTDNYVKGRPYLPKDYYYITHYKLGNCYRTSEEAEANRDKWVAFYASDEVLEV